MSKYYKAEDVIRRVAEYISIDYPTEERAREDAELLFVDLPTIEVSEGCINGYKDGQKDMLVFLLEGMKNALEKARNEKIEELL